MLLLIFTTYIAMAIRFEGVIPVYYLNLFARSVILFTCFKTAVYYFFSLYSSLWEYASIDEVIQIFLAVTIGQIVEFIFGLIFDMSYPKSIYAIAYLVSLLLVGANRLSFRVIKRLKRAVWREANRVTKVMIIGAGDAGSLVIREMQNHSEWFYVPVVVIDDNKSKHRTKIRGVPVAGDRSKIVQLASKYKVDEIIITMPSVPKQVTSDIIKCCKQTRCRLRTLPGVYGIINDSISFKKIRDVVIEDLLGRDEIKLNNEEISDYLKDEVVLVTGGGGSIGSELCRQIAKYNPKKLLILDIYENNAYDLEMELSREYKENLSKEVIIASVRDKERLRKIFDKYNPSIIFHAAAHKHVPLMEHNPSEAIKNNVLGTLNVAQCADEYNAKRFVFISTDKAVNPTNVMGTTKRTAEMLIQSLDRQSKTEFVAVRFGNVLGSNGSVIPLFKKQIAGGGPVTVTHPEITRFFMTIPEAARLVVQAGAMAMGGEIFVLDMGESVKIVDLAKDLIILSGLEPNEDIEIKFTGLRPGEKLYEELLLAEEGVMETKHEHIFIGKPSEQRFEDVMVQVKILLNNLDNPVRIRECLANIVDTYKYNYEEVAVTSEAEN